MTEVYLKKNQETGRFECYNALTDEFISILTCGNFFIYLPDDEDLEVPGRIEHSVNRDYYWIDSESLSSISLYNGMRGYIE